MLTLNERASDIIQVLQSRATSAIRFAEAYEGGRQTLVIDGTMYSPSSRAIPGMENAWESLTDEEFIELDEMVEFAISQFELEEDTDGAPESWTLHWEDGCLLATLPELED